jgi:hypothetical protein
MGYGGKIQERRRARELRAQSWTLLDIARELNVSKASVSVWVRDVEFVPKPRNRGHPSHRPHPLTIKKQAELQRCRAEAAVTIGQLSDRDILVYGLALYLGEGAKTSQSGFGLANTSVEVMVSFMVWLRRCFEIDESRMRARLYLHEGLDLEAATVFWSDALGIPAAQFTAAYRPESRDRFRGSKHPNGCITVRYSDVTLHRRVMALISALTSQFAIPG